MSQDPSRIDRQYQEIPFARSEREHGYGKNIHILSDPYLTSLLSRLSSPDTQQPWINDLVTRLYEPLLVNAINAEFEQTDVELPTRMQEFHKVDGVYRGKIINPKQKAVSVNLARAGTLPSHICYTLLNYLLEPALVRQDHISIARQTDGSDKVTGAAVSGHKIGGPVDDSIVLIPDPMGATGGTIDKILELYKGHGTAKRFIALHLIITPEYIRKLAGKHPELSIYAIRLDRGLSPEDVLQTGLGQDLDREKGLNDKDYIVPGAGGVGEILNNAFV